MPDASMTFARATFFILGGKRWFAEACAKAR
jgi:hypothetical protein